LYASKLMKRKHPALLLEAFAQVLQADTRTPAPCLLFIGSGEEEAHLKARAAELPAGAVQFLGFQNQTALPRYYDLCDIFVLASEHEPWGLVVNEVMNAAKPLIVSDQVGSARDLVIPGENGWVIPAGSRKALADALADALSQPQRLVAFGQASLARMASWGIPQNVENLCAALRPLCAETAR
jgi:glycosyltransferase involved in cell wall biosynthesis